MHIIQYSYSWTATKEQLNIKKHGISFSTAIRIFDNDITYDEMQIVDGEERWKTIGPVDGIVLVVISTERPPYTRIISARPAEGEIRQSLWERRKHGRAIF